MCSVIPSHNASSSNPTFSSQGAATQLPQCPDSAGVVKGCGLYCRRIVNTLSRLPSYLMSTMGSAFSRYLGHSIDDDESLLEMNGIPRNNNEASRLSDDNNLGYDGKDARLVFITE